MVRINDTCVICVICVFANYYFEAVGAVKLIQCCRLRYFEFQKIYFFIHPVQGIKKVDLSNLNYPLRIVLFDNSNPAGLKVI